MASVLSKATSKAVAKALTAALGGAATPGHLLVSGIDIDKNAGSVPAPSEGWKLVDGNNSTSVSIALAYRIADGTELDQCKWGWTNTQSAAAWILEADGFDAGVIVKHLSAFTNEASVKAAALGPVVAEGEGLAIGSIAIDTADAWDLGEACAKWTEGFSEQIYPREGSDNAGGSVAWRTVEDAETVSTTATPADSEAIADQVSGILVVFGAEEEEPPEEGPTGLPARLPSSAGATRTLESGETLQSALDDASPGETILVPAGTYAAPATAVEGDEGAPVTLLAKGMVETTGRWKLDGAGFLRLQGIHHNGVASPDVGVWVTKGAHDIEWYGGSCHHSQESGFFVGREGGECERIHFIAARANHNGQQKEPTENLDHGFYLNGTDLLVLNCIIDNNAALGLQAYESCDGLIVASCTVVDNRRAGILIGGSADHASTNCRVVNNICVGNEFGVRDFWGGTPGSGNKAWGNLIYDSVVDDYFISDSEAFEVTPLDLGDDGVERVPNGSFEVDLAGWASNAFVTVTSTRVNTWASAGSWSHRIQWEDATPGRNNGRRTTIGTGGIAVTPGQAIRARATINVAALPAGSTGSFLHLMFYDAEGEELADSAPTATRYSGTGIHEMENIAVPPAGAAFFSVGVLADSGSGGSYDARVDGVSARFTPSTDPLLKPTLRPQVESPAVGAADGDWLFDTDFTGRSRTLETLGAMEPFSATPPPRVLFDGSFSAVTRRIRSEGEWSG